METREIIGWDIGGAHLKTASVDTRGRLLGAAQHATPLWQGLECLETVLKSVRGRIGGSVAGHALTMTGELADIFPSRRDGVRRLLDLFADHFNSRPILVYDLPGGLIPIQDADAGHLGIASANWHATARFVAQHVERGIVVDIGSTTTDIVPFAAGDVAAAGQTDQERLRCGELVYTGVVRTPLMAIVRRVPFAGAWQGVAAELFAASADVYRITGELDEAWDLMAPADNAGKSLHDSIRRLARMVGADPGCAIPDHAWYELAAYIAARQLAIVEEALSQVMSRTGPGGVMVGCGCGAFLVRKLAARLGREFVEFDSLLEAPGPAASVSAPAVAVAQLARGLLQ